MEVCLMPKLQKRDERGARNTAWKEASLDHVVQQQKQELVLYQQGGRQELTSDVVL